MPTETPSTGTRAFTEIDPATLKSWLDSGECTLVDVREADEHAGERIEGASLMPLSRFDAAQLPTPAGRRLVMHCRAGKRGSDAARMAAASAVPGVQVHNLKGGIEAWKQAGLPVRTGRGGGRMSVMRQVQVTIGTLALAGSALAWFVDTRWIALPAFLGAGLVFAGLSGTCGMASLLARMPWNRSCGCGSGSCST